MKHLKTIKLTALVLMLLASACHKENVNEIAIPYGVELITQPGDCECKKGKIFEMVDTTIYLYSSFIGDTVYHNDPNSLIYFKDTLLFWLAPWGRPRGPVCNPPEILKSIEIPIAGLKVKARADFYLTCNPSGHGGEFDNDVVIVTSFIIQKP